MNRTLLIAAALAAGIAFSVPAAAVEHARGTPEKRAEEAAKQGPDALRRFIWRTRMIYMLNIYDYRVPEGKPSGEQTASKVSPVLEREQTTVAKAGR
jgi:hypothetical protein